MDRFTQISDTTDVDGSVLGDIVRHAIAAYPKEACGMLLRRSAESRAADSFRLDNKAQPGRAGSCFITDPLEIFEAERKAEEKGYEIAGFYHSHPDRWAVLSDEDVKYMIPGMLYIILSVTGHGCKEAKGYVRQTADGECTGVMIHPTK